MMLGLMLAPFVSRLGRGAPAETAGPGLALWMPDPGLLEEWEASGGPVVVMVPDQLGVDERCT